MGLLGNCVVRLSLLRQVLGLFSKIRNYSIRFSSVPILPVFVKHQETIQ